jgi:aryl-alcohol dehydrogenase-like predicted oxidoreductase
MKAEGIIGHVGLGVRSHDFHRRAIETGDIDIVLTYADYTLLNQSAAQTTLPLAAQHDVGLIVASVLDLGGLTGRDPQKPLAQRMVAWCEERRVDIRHLAIQFCMALEIDGVVMPGPGTKEHVEQVYRFATTEIDPEIWRQFEAEFGIAPSADGLGRN